MKVRRDRIPPPVLISPWPDNATLWGFWGQRSECTLGQNIDVCWAISECNLGHRSKYILRGKTHNGSEKSALAVWSSLWLITWQNCSTGRMGFGNYISRSIELNLNI